uniref:CCHC-type domain-containing protein n=1 Tax=Phlebotomus papatasi TaxID=29031 RepID=A0A1B0DIU8_PHLPP
MDDTKARPLSLHTSAGIPCVANKSRKTLITSTDDCARTTRTSEGETIKQFVMALHVLARYCKFHDVEDMITDRMVCGVRDVSLRKKLLEHPALKFDEAMEIALASESADAGAKEMTKAIVSEVHKSCVAGEATVDKVRLCFRCGNPHDPERCWAKDRKCHFCKKKGHIRSKCVAMKEGKNIHATTDASDSDEEKVKHLSGRVGGVNVLGQICPEECVDVQINGVTTGMEVDSGATVSVMPVQIWKKIANPGTELKKSSIHLKTWLSQGVVILGEVNVEVTLGKKKAILPLLITEKGGSPLLGRNWFKPLGIEIRIAAVEEAVDSKTIKEGTLHGNADALSRLPLPWPIIDVEEPDNGGHIAISREWTCDRETNSEMDKEGLNVEQSKKMGTGWIS